MCESLGKSIIRVSNGTHFTGECLLIFTRLTVFNKLDEVHSFQQGLPSVDPDTDEDEQFAKIEDAVELVGLLNYQDRRSTGHRLSDMLLRCVFQGQACHSR